MKKILMSRYSDPIDILDGLLALSNLRRGNAERFPESRGKVIAEDSSRVARDAEGLRRGH
jgi:hypothetical protein